MTDLHVDFLSGPMRELRKSARTKNQILSKAVGWTSGCRTLIDVTAGLGKDSFLLLCLGFKVTAIERSSEIYKVLREGVDRALDDSELGPLFSENFKLIHADAITWLSELSDSDRPDVIYMDPMYPVRKKSALPKKEMQMFREIVGDDLDSAKLFSMAMSKAKKRVVVKRPSHADFFKEPATHSFEGNLVRYDMYSLNV